MIIFVRYIYQNEETNRHYSKQRKCGMVLFLYVRNLTVKIYQQFYRLFDYYLVIELRVRSHNGNTKRTMLIKEEDKGDTRG